MMRSPVLALAVGFAAALAAVFLEPSAGAHSGGSAPSRVVDRTVLCVLAGESPGELDVEARSGTRDFSDRSKWRMLATGSFIEPGRALPARAAIYAGWPPVQRQGDFPLGPRSAAESLRYSSRCRPSRARVPLSSAGLSGGKASPFRDEYDCLAPRRILVRIRGIFHERTSLRRQRGRFFDDLVARGGLKQGFLAVRTSAGKPIAFITVHEAGNAQIFVGDSCGPNA
jgi:hypothetical protein